MKLTPSSVISSGTLRYSGLTGTGMLRRSNECGRAPIKEHVGEDRRRDAAHQLRIDDRCRDQEIAKRALRVAEVHEGRPINVRAQQHDGPAKFRPAAAGGSRAI